MKEKFFLHKIITALLILIIFAVGVVCVILINIQTISAQQMHRANDITLPPSDNFQNIFWFVQISDIHVSSHHDPARVTDLKDFVQNHLNIINPSFVLATGDLVDAKSKDDLSTQADLEEWKAYSSILEETGITERIPWLDLRGNHDCFNVRDRNHESNRFKSYSAMGRKFNLHSYKYTHETSYGTYSFIGIDACPEPGLKRPFNFFGTLSDRDAVELRRMAKETTKHNFTIWFAHYPTATLSVKYSTLLKPTLESTNTLAYLCGHLHHLGGITNTMYARQQGGHLELELADWKANRRYRIMAIDHDLFSFVDTNYKKWPVILVTNPKDARLSAPIVEPLARVKVSTHIRILVFTPFQVESVEVSIDRVKLGSARHIEGPLYVLKWSPSDYSVGLHKLNVRVRSGQSNSIVTSYFSLDGKFPIYSYISSVILHSHPSSIIYYLFYLVWSVFILAIIFSFYSPHNFATYFFFLEWTRVMKMHTKLNSIWLLANIYIVFGPWCVGEVNSHYPNGIIYLSGVQLPSSYLSHYYMYGIALEQLLTFNIPSTFLLVVTAWGRKIPRNIRSLSNMLLYAIIINHIKRCYYFMRWFGWIGSIINPSTTWMLLLYIYYYVHIKRESNKHTH